MIAVHLPPRWTAARMDKLLAPLQRPDRVSEAQWQNIVHQLLDGYGWTRLHIPPVRVGKRWITPGRRGFPDICALHPSGICLVLELKTVAGDLGSDGDQLKWLGLWTRVARRAPGVVHAFVARPNQLELLLPLIAKPTLDSSPTPYQLALDVAAKPG